MRRVLLASILCGGLGLACGGPPKSADDRAAEKKTENKAEAETPPEQKDEAAPEKAPALSEEDQRLISADPATLSPEDRRKRAYALRRKIMQDPNSESAKAIKEGMKAIESGELQVPPHLLSDEAGSRPAATGPVLSAPEPKAKESGNAGPEK